MGASLSRRKAMFSAVSACVAAMAPGAARASQLPSCLLRGFNLPDQVPLRADRKPQRTTLQALKKRGMTHVRLPVIAENIFPAFSGSATIANALDDLSAVVDALLSLGYAVSVDIHADDELSVLLDRDPTRAREALAKGWCNLGRHMARWPTEFIFAELLNEPPTTDEVWRNMAEFLVKEVRGELPKTHIIVGPAPYQRLEALAGWTPLTDERIVYGCHYYSPMLFTHQGSDWDQGSPWGRASGVPFPSRVDDPILLRMAQRARARGDTALSDELRQMAQQAWNARAIDNEFSAVAAWSARNSAPVVINEFGVLKEKADPVQRLAWLAATRKAAEAHGFGWAHWDFSNGFGLLDEEGAIDEGVMRALFSG